MLSENPLLNQLLHDESFFQWVHRTDPSAVAHWETWIAQHPEHHTIVAEAAQIVRGIPFASRSLSEAQVHHAWLDLQQRLSVTENVHHNQPIRRSRTWLPRAAVVTLALLAGALVWWIMARTPAQSVYTTAYGETRDYQLPDGSLVTLNAHSQVTYQEQTHPEPVREVWLEGEAFFRVVHQERNQPIPFVVHTPDLMVQVLGTAFNVNTRRGRTQVVLDAGSVALQLPSEKTAMMQPGELVEYTAQKAILHQEAVKTKRYTAWRERRLTFDDTPLSEVALVLEENYGVKVIFDTPALRNKRVTGEISANNIDTILKALSTLFAISVQRSGDTVRIHVSP